MATSSSRSGAIPVHSESLKPMTNSSSAIESSSSDRALRVAGTRSAPAVVILRDSSVSGAVHCEAVRPRASPGLSVRVLPPACRA